MQMVLTINSIKVINGQQSAELWRQLSEVHSANYHRSAVH